MKVWWQQCNGGEGMWDNSAVFHIKQLKEIISNCPFSRLWGGGGFILEVFGFCFSTFLG